jgi:UDP-glucuronate decarboxylase
VDTIRANVQGAFELLELCRASGGAGFVLMSSAEVYGQRADDDGLVDERGYGAVDILNPAPRTRRASARRRRSRSATTRSTRSPSRSRASATSSAPAWPLDDGRVQADFAADVLGGRDIVINSDGSARRTYTLLADAVSGMFTALLLGEDTAYNIADRDGFVSILELAAAFARSRPERGLKVGFRDGVDVSANSPVRGQGLDDTKLRALGWAPRVGFEPGIDRTLAWHEERGGL